MVFYSRFVGSWDIAANITIYDKTSHYLSMDEMGVSVTKSMDALRTNSWWQPIAMAFAVVFDHGVRQHRRLP
jgi:hypothetical protein